MLPMLRLEGMAEVAQKRLYFVRGLLQVRGRSARCGRWIVQFVGQTRCHRAERNQLFPLLGVTFEVPHAVGRRAKNLTGNRLASDQHPPEALFIYPEQSSRFGHAACRQPRYIQQQHGFAQVVSRFIDAQKDRLPIIRARRANFTFEQHMEETRPLSFRGQHGADRRFNNLAGFDTTQLRVSQSGEQRSGTDLLEFSRVQVHKRPRYWWTSFTAMAPSPTPEVTPLADRCRTSPATKIPGTLVSR